MSDKIKDDFDFQIAGTLIAMRVVLAAVLKEHQEPEKLRKTIIDLAEMSGATSGKLPSPIRENFDNILQELTSHLDVRLTSDR